MPLATSQQIALELVTVFLKFAFFGVLVYRHIWREFPILTIFSASMCARSALMVSLLHGPILRYFFAYWITQAIQSALMLAVVVEIIEDVCLPGRMLSSRVMRLFGWFALSVSVAAYTLVHLQNPTRFPILNAFISLDRICAYVALGILGVLVGFSQFFSVRWRTLARASAIGLSAVTLITTVLPSSSQYFPGFGRTVVLIVSPVVTAFVLVMWIVVAFGWKRAARCCSSVTNHALNQLLDRASQLDRETAA